MKAQLKIDPKKIKLREKLPEVPYRRMEFPLHVLPKEIQELIKSYSDAFDVSNGVVAASMLTIISGVLGNSMRIKVKENWEEPPFLWTGIVAKSGFGKTPVINCLLNPVKVKERYSIEKYKKELERYEEEIKDYEKLKKSKTRVESIEKPTKPRQEHFLMTDTTREALFDALQCSDRGLNLFHDELASFVKGHDQYKSGGNDRQKYLELWSSSTIKVHRLNSGTTFIKNPGVSILGGIQPMALPHIFKHDSFIDGLFPRFLLVNFDEKPDGYFSFDVVDDITLNQWNDLINSLYESPLVKDKAGNINFNIVSMNEDSEAILAFAEFYNHMGLLKDSYVYYMEPFAPKLISYCARLSGVLHRLKSDSDIISEDTVRGAIEICNYFWSELISVMRLYFQDGKELNQLDRSLLRTLDIMNGECCFSSGKIKLASLLDRLKQYDSVVADDLSPSGLAHCLKRFGFKTKIIGGYSHFIYDPDLSEKLFNMYCS